MGELKVGDTVVLLKIPDSLIHDLPEEEQEEIRSFIGKTAEITEIDDFGNCWIGFGTQSDEGEYSDYTGHSFSITEDCLRKTEN